MRIQLRISGLYGRITYYKMRRTTMEKLIHVWYKDTNIINDCKKFGGLHDQSRPNTDKVSWGSYYVMMFIGFVCIQIK